MKWVEEAVMSSHSRQPAALCQLDLPPAEAQEFGLWSAGLEIL